MHMRSAKRQAAWDITGGYCFYCRMRLLDDFAPFSNASENLSKLEIKRLKLEQQRVMQIDHKTPLARGGRDVAENRVPACGPCNAQKQKMTPDEYRWYLLTYGIEPSFFDSKHARRDWLCVAKEAKYSAIPAARERFSKSEQV